MEQGTWIEEEEAAGTFKVPPAIFFKITDSKDDAAALKTKAYISSLVVLFYLSVSQAQVAFPASVFLFQREKQPCLALRISANETLHQSISYYFFQSANNKLI